MKLTTLLFALLLVGCATSPQRFTERRAVIPAPDTTSVQKSVSSVKQSVQSAQTAAAKAHADADTVQQLAEKLMRVNVPQVQQDVTSIQVANKDLQLQLETTSSELTTAQTELESSNTEIVKLEEQIKASEAEKTGFVNSYNQAAKENSRLADETVKAVQKEKEWRSRALKLGAVLGALTIAAIAFLVIKLGIHIPIPI